MRETRVRPLGWEDPLEKEMATHSSTVAWKIPWTEEPSRLQSMGSQRVRHDWATSLSFILPVSETSQLLKSLDTMSWEGRSIVSVAFLPLMQNLHAITGEINKSKPRDFLPSKWPDCLKSVMKSKERQWNSYILDRTEEIWQLNIMCDSQIGFWNREKTLVKNW